MPTTCAGLPASSRTLRELSFAALHSDLCRKNIFQLIFCELFFPCTVEALSVRWFDSEWLREGRLVEAGAEAVMAECFSPLATVRPLRHRGLCCYAGILIFLAIQTNFAITEMFGAGKKIFFVYPENFPVLLLCLDCRWKLNTSLRVDG